jgi:hypothetical protein
MSPRFWFDLFALFVSGFYLSLFLIWLFRTVWFRFLSVIVIDLTFSKLFASGFYLLLFLTWLFSTVCFRILSVIVFDWPFRTVCFRFLSAIYQKQWQIETRNKQCEKVKSKTITDRNLKQTARKCSKSLNIIPKLFSTVCFRILSVIVFDWPFRTVCFRFLSAIVFDLTFLHSLLQVSICYCFWFDLLALFASGFYLLLFLIEPERVNQKQ